MLAPADLERDYGIRVSQLRRHEGGCESECWVADGTWFVKHWRKPEARPRLALLADLAVAGLPVPRPVPTLAGALSSIADGCTYAVFPFVPGRTATDDDWRLTAASLRQVHEVTGVEVPPASWDEPRIAALGERLDHPWIRERRGELEDALDRMAGVTERARAAAYEPVVCHTDFLGQNLLVADGRVAAILDWDWAVLGPRERDVWVAAEGGHGPELLAAYGARDLDATQLEYALLARALADLAGRVLEEVDRPGVDTWGFDRITRLDDDLTMFRPFCR